MKAYRQVVLAGAVVALGCTWALAQNPTVSIEAVQINDRTINPTNSVNVKQGDTIVAEIHAYDWSPNGELLRGMQAGIDTEGFRSGDSGTVRSVGFDRPLTIGELTPCESDADCSEEWPVCSSAHHFSYCVGPDYDPDLGVFIDSSKSDYFLYDREVFTAVDTLEFRLMSTLFYREEALPYAPPYSYFGTLVLEVSEDACGTFTIDFILRDDYGGVQTYMITPDYAQIEPLGAEPLSVTVRACHDLFREPPDGGDVPPAE